MGTRIPVDTPTLNPDFYSEWNRVPRPIVQAPIMRRLLSHPVDGQVPDYPGPRVAVMCTVNVCHVTCDRGGASCHLSVSVRPVIEP